MNEGRIASSRGIDAAAAEFDAIFEELQVPHSTALHARNRASGKPYLVGPLARVTLNADRLSPAAAAARDSLAARFEQPDPAASVFARSIEVIQAIDDALAVCDADSRRPPARTRRRFRAPASGTPSPRRRGASSTSRSRPTRRATSSDCASCRRRRRTRRRSRPTCAHSHRASSRSPKTRAVASPKRRSATTTRASRCATHFLRVTVERREACAST